MPQRRQNPDRHRQAAQHVAHRRAGSGRFAVGPAGRAHQAAHRLGNDIVARSVLVRSIVAEPGHGGIDQAGIQLAQLFIAQTQFFHRSRPVILQHDIRRFDQRAKQLFAFGRLEVDGNPFLIPVQVHEIGALAVLERAEMPFIRSFSSLLHLDHVRAQIRQHHAGEWTGQHPGHIQDHESGQCSVT